MADCASPTFAWQGALTAEDTAQLAMQVAELARAGLPLDAGLRAMAQELPHGRLQRVVDNIAYRLQTGQSVDQALQGEGPSVPPHLRGLLLAGIRSGKLPKVLEEFMDLEIDATELRRRLWISLAYPFCLLAVLAVLALFLHVGVVEPIRESYRELGTSQSEWTQVFLTVSGPLAYVLFIETLVVLAIALLCVVLPRARWVARIVHSIPLIGPALRLSRLAQFARLLALLLEQQIPLPEALRLAGTGSRDPETAAGSALLAADVEAGQLLSASLAQCQFPVTLVPLVEWGERTGALDEAFRAGADIFQGQSHNHTRTIEILLLPTILLVIILVLSVFVGAIMLPMMDLLRLSFYF